ncbi:MAG: J domain-containing protein [Phycisphaerae bacterium]
MTGWSKQSDEALRRFLRRVWRADIEPLLRGKYAAQRRKSARVGGKVAATGGLVLDSLFRLRGRPFTRAMSVMGSSLGAMLPDVWDWNWFRASADEADQKVVTDQVKRRAAQLPEADGLALFGLAPTASYEQLKHAWRITSQRWHPDKAADTRHRTEYQVRFVAYQAAYERLCRAYDEGRLPRENSE